ncbi:hypothetical protein EVAR_80348_1 [Eumeta japonica]|uniref:Uncharacterized protein n=1 Tax=Eumeta variegata TaxID=151549 RepID=A0A4C1X2T4_EUMVA|nr:hypothetical protein EVAR_80348_1 [Eumeta japonica]
MASVIPDRQRQGGLMVSEVTPDEKQIATTPPRACPLAAAQVVINGEKPLFHPDSPASPAHFTTKMTVVAPKQTTVGVKNISAAGTKPSPPTKVKLPPPICFREKS